MTSEEIIDIFKSTGALLEGHFILTSGYHSNHYFQCAKVLQYPDFLTKLTSELLLRIKEKDFDVVISPAIGGIVLGTETGRQLNIKTIFAERLHGNMTLRRGFELLKNDKVLIVEDVVTTGGSVKEIIQIVKESNAVPAAAGFIIDRSNGRVDFGIPQYSLAKFETVKYLPKEIPDWLEKIPISKPGSRETT